MVLTSSVKAQSLGKIVTLDSINPGEVWPDTNGNHIQAHGGGIIKIKKTYFLDGRSPGVRNFAVFNI